MTHFHHVKRFSQLALFEFHFYSWSFLFDKTKNFNLFLSIKKYRKMSKYFLKRLNQIDSIKKLRRNIFI